MIKYGNQLNFLKIISFQSEINVYISHLFIEFYCFLSDKRIITNRSNFEKCFEKTLIFLHFLLFFCSEAIELN